MSKAFKIFLAFLACLLLIYAIWILFPRVSQSERIELALQDASKRFGVGQTDASDPTKNGFLNETFLPHWGRRDIESDRDDPVVAVVYNWTEFSSDAVGDVIDHPALLGAQDAKYMKAMTSFETIAPELVEQVRKPIFSENDSPLTANSVIMNYIAVRSSAYALVGLAEAREAQQRPEEAGDLLVAVIEWGRHMQNHRTLIQEMIAVSVQSIGYAAFMENVAPRQKISGKVWRTWAGRLIEAVPEKDQVLHAMEGEILFVHNSAKDAGRAPSKEWDEELFPAYLKAPGAIAREVRIYDNWMAEYLNLVDKGDLSSARYPGKLTLGDVVRGSNGPLAANAIPDFGRVSYQCHLNRGRIIGLALTASVAAYRAEKGRLPASLEEIETATIPILDEQTRQQAGVTYDVVDKHAEIRVPYQDLVGGTPVAELPANRPRPWLEYRDGKSIYII